MAVMSKFGSRKDAMLHGRLTAWDFASCLAQWSNNASNEVFVDFDSLEEIDNPVNLNFHHHEELVNRSEDELKTYHDILTEPFPQRTESIRYWYENCVRRIQHEETSSNTSVEPLDLDFVCEEIKTAATVRFFGGSSLRILRQFLERGVADKMKCHLQVVSLKMQNSLFVWLLTKSRVPAICLRIYSLISSISPSTEKQPRLSWNDPQSFHSSRSYLHTQRKV